MTYEGWLSFGGNEIINNPRAIGMQQTADCPVFWLKNDWCLNLAPALDHTDYRAQSILQQPWYDPANHDVSSRFYGAYAIDVDGLPDADRRQQMTEGIQDGVTLGSARRGPKRVRVKAILIGKGKDAIDYGRSWLDAALSPSVCAQHGTRCGVTDLEFFADCPPSMSDFVTQVETTPVLNSTNRATSPSFESGSGGWIPDHGLPSATQSYPSDGGFSGTRYFRTTFTANDNTIEGGHRIDDSTFVIGNTYTYSVYVRVSVAQRLRPEISAVGGSVLEYGTAIDIPANTWTRLSMALTVPTGTTQVRFSYRAVSGGFGHQWQIGETLDLDAAMITETAELTPYFDGSTPSDDNYVYAWTGAVNNSSSTRSLRQYIETPDLVAYQKAVDGLRRYLHSAAVTSGPFTVERMQSGPFEGHVVEFTITSERAFVYGVTGVVDLPSSLSTVVQDIPYNLLTHPSAELGSGSVVTARNLSANPSVETDASGWSASSATVSGTSPAAYFTSGRSTSLFAVGTAAMRGRILGNGSTEVSSSTARVLIQQDVSLSGLATNTRVSLNVWAAAIIAAGASGSNIDEMTAYVEWRNAGLLSTTQLGTAASNEYGGRPFMLDSQTIPAGATIARVIVEFEVDWRSSATPANNSDIQMYVDALAVTVP